MMHEYIGIFRETAKLRARWVLDATEVKTDEMNVDDKQFIDPFFVVIDCQLSQFDARWSDRGVYSCILQDQEPSFVS